MNNKKLLITLAAGVLCKDLIDKMIKEYGLSKTLSVMAFSIGASLTTVAIGMVLIPNKPQIIIIEKENNNEN